MGAEQNTQGDSGAASGAEPTFEDIMQFDPFESGPSGDETGETGAAAPPAQGQEPPAAQQQAPTPQAAQPPLSQPPTQQPDLRQLVQEQTNQLMGALRAGQQPQPQQQGGPPQKFNLGVPPQLTAALRSEDPQQFEAGVGALINGVSNHVWNTVMDHIQREVLPTIPRAIEAFAQSAQRQDSVARDFYGVYPQLAHDGIRPMVQMVGAQIAEEFARQGRSLGWSGELRDAIAERIFTMIPALRAQQAQAAQQAAPRRQPFATGNGSRPPPRNDSTLQSEMEAVIFGPRNY